MKPVYNAGHTGPTDCTTAGRAFMGQDLYDNPLGTDGFEFVEFTGPDPLALGQLFETWASPPWPAIVPRTYCATSRVISTSS